MNTHPDFEELLRLLEEHHVEYMIVGGYAVAYHGHPRFTKDIDVFFRRSEDNAKRLREALLVFGFREEDLPLEAFTTIGNVLTFGVVPTRVDLINEICITGSPEQMRERLGEFVAGGITTPVLTPLCAPDQLPELLAGMLPA